MKNFQLSIVNTIKAFDIKESFAMDNLFECWLDSDLDSLCLELVIGDTRNGAEFTVKLYDVDNAKSCVVLTGDYSGLTALKTELKDKLRDLNKKTEAELTALVNSVKTDIDVFVTTKHNKVTFAWCAESDEYKVFADSKADAIKEIKEAMILDGIINPVLNVIDGDYSLANLACKADR